MTKNLSITGLACLLLLGSSTARGQATGEDPRLRVPLERYSVSPYLQDSFIFLQGTTLERAVKLDFSLGLKWMRQPLRLKSKTGEDDYILQAPVEDQLQIRPAVTFAYGQWFDIAAVLPIIHQTPGPVDSFPTLDGQQGGVFLLDPELFLRVPVLHERAAGFGLAFAGQLFLPLGTQQAFAGLPRWQSSVLMAVDWAYKNFSLLLNTGFFFRGERYTSVESIEIGSEWFIRPGVTYSLAMGSYKLGFSAEANFQTSVETNFSDDNVNAIQFLFSLLIQPAEVAGGFYANLGSGARMQDGGYGVPYANLDGRLGYSMQWEIKEPVYVAEAPVAPPPPREEEKPVEPPPPPEVPAEAVEEVPVAAPTPPAPVPEEQPEEVEEVTPEEIEPEPLVAVVPPKPPPPVEKVEPAPPPVKAEPRPVEAARVTRIGTLVVKSDQMATASAEIPRSQREGIAASKSVLLEELQTPGATLLIVGHSDKCFQGAPYLANQYNRELSQERVDAMLSFLREVMGAELRDVEIRTLAMGRRCANPKCRCVTPEMPECANDRKVEVFVQHGEQESYTCPHGVYWLAR
jgi:outer membrane protein OmpA-like peptidoglycan-associated protein